MKKLIFLLLFTVASYGQNQSRLVSLGTANATLTGTPTAPTAPVGTNTTQIATTAFVQAAVSTGATSVIKYLTPISHTGTTSPTILVDILIPANTIAASGVYKLFISGSRGAGSGTGCEIYSYMTGDASYPIRGLGIANGANSITHVERTFQFYSGNKICFSDSGGFYTDVAALHSRVVSTFDTTVDNHLYVGMALSNALETYSLDYVILKRID